MNSSNDVYFMYSLDAWCRVRGRKMSKTNMNTDCSECFNDLSQRHLMYWLGFDEEAKVWHISVPRRLSLCPERRSGQIYFVGSDNPVHRVYRSEERGSIACPSVQRCAGGRTEADDGKFSFLVLDVRCPYPQQFSNGFPPSSPLSLVVFHWAPRLPKRATEGRLLVHVSRESQFGYHLLKRGKKTQMKVAWIIPRGHRQSTFRIKGR